MTKSTSQEHQDSQGSKPKGRRRGSDGTNAIGIDPAAKDPGNARGDHPKKPHSGKPS